MLYLHNLQRTGSNPPDINRLKILFTSFKPHPFLFLFWQIQAGLSRETGHIPVQNIPTHLNKEGEPEHSLIMQNGLDTTRFSLNRFEIV